ncbi:phosphoribosylanthranilate isomerase [Pseudoxanthobacter soli DSM 19599]|uniref:N-(5'-phosphoribosyl)anthranilate isomerase n=1 Tax=Pseudoxanthobacter soli DSM 19599 TaxID=1123029 RepID=A0A1M7ZML7_9HYPH|nr:phosphoribosylanthranilate isomerase [Pseudoxanthobacter soli]SHO66140.1 phosphoribosylanthranilate isomerase [Pseudoxanthobacter soli DSM 19599]
MSLVVKICGLKTPETVEAAIDAGADMIGFVFFPKSPRHLGFQEAAELARLARGRAEIVALVVDAGDGMFAAISDEVRPDWFQLHGHETPERVAAVGDLFGRRVMKAIGVRTAEDLEALGHFPAADRLLLDAKAPHGASRPGGNGRAFDWNLLAHLDHAPPFMLSGGLGPENVREAIAKVRPFGIDVSSGVETAPGVKDPERIAAFVAAARAAEAELAASRPAQDAGGAV